MSRGNLVHPFCSHDEKDDTDDEDATGAGMGKDTQELLRQVTKKISSMVTQCQEACLLRINEGLALQSEALERIDEVYHLYGERGGVYRQTSKKPREGGKDSQQGHGSLSQKGHGSMSHKGHGSMSHKVKKKHGSILHKGSVFVSPEFGGTQNHQGKRHTFLMRPLTGAHAPLVVAKGHHAFDKTATLPSRIMENDFEPEELFETNGSSSVPLQILPAINSDDKTEGFSVKNEDQPCGERSTELGLRSTELGGKKCVAMNLSEECVEFEREDVAGTEDATGTEPGQRSNNKHLKSIVKSKTQGGIITRKTKPMSPHFMRSTKKYGTAFLGIYSLEGVVVKIVNHPAFDLVSGLLIFVNTALIGAETDYMAKNAGKTSKVYDDIRTAFFCLFSLELLFRVIAQGRAFLGPADRGWNLFDSFMVLSSATEICFQFLDTGNTASTGRVLRILRIVRITRAMRIGRILRYARTFRQIAYSLQSSMGTLFWAMVMIFLVIYCFAISFCQAATDHLIGKQLETAYLVNMNSYYGSVSKSLYHLYKAMTGGQNWGEVAAPLEYLGWFNMILFLAFISLTFFGVLNVVTAIFVDSAMQSQQHYKDLLIQENLAKKQLYSNHLREVFATIDKDNDGSIAATEMEHFLCDPELNLYLESIDIFPNDARGLFRLLDRDESGCVSIDEFCEGCLRLKGEAKAFDIHCLIHNVEKSHQRIEDIIDYLNELGLVMGYADSVALN